MVVLPSPFSTNHSARIMSLMTGGKGQIVLLLRTGLRFVHQIQRDVAHGRGTEGADPKRSDAEAGEEELVAGTKGAFGDFAQSAAGNRALALEGDRPWQ